MSSFLFGKFILAVGLFCSAVGRHRSLDRHITHETAFPFRSFDDMLTPPFHLFCSSLTSDLFRTPVFIPLAAACSVDLLRVLDKGRCWL
ncbi:hypothetical protein BJV78DRAFT_1235433 [Lactifluus subvellereus]|nr:hypothetical protein BJV78DRAFT_1235433 [Lactifluus subvellereus]